MACGADPEPASKGERPTAAASTTTEAESAPTPIVAPTGAPAPDLRKVPLVSAAALLADRERTPLGNQYPSGLIFVQAGTSPFTWTAGVGFQPHTAPADGYLQGSRHVAVPWDGQSMLALDMSIQNSIEQIITFDAQRANWSSGYFVFSSPVGSKLGDGRYTIDVLPGDSTDHYTPYALLPTSTDVFMVVQRKKKETEHWPVAGVTRAVQATVCDAWVTRAPRGGSLDFAFRGLVAEPQHYRELLSTAGLSEFQLPLYYACAPRCIAVGEQRLVCALRASADDDDTQRPLDPAAIFEPPTSTPPAGVPAFPADRIIRYVYAPEVQGTGLYYQPKNTVPIPPLMLATSDDGGASWTRRLISTRGGVDSHFAYEPATGLLVLAYGGLTYPRRGIAVQWSKDRGETWSEPMVVTDDDDAFTTGTVYLANTAPGQFLLVYDSLANFMQYDYVNKQRLTDGHRVRWRSLSFLP